MQRNAERFREEVAEVFRIYDEGNSGTIDVSECAAALHLITGDRIPREELLRTLRRTLQMTSTEVDLKTFEAVVAERIQQRPLQDEVRAAFQLLQDPNAPGYITTDSVRRAAQEVDEQLTEEELTEMFDQQVTGMLTPAVDYATFCMIQYAAQTDH